jgi:hypothetical protein
VMATKDLFFAQLTKFCDLAKQKPAAWLKNDMKPVRHLFQYCLENRENYPFPGDDIQQLLPEASLQHNERDVKEMLSKDFVMSLVNDTWTYDMDDDDEPTVQILASETKFKKGLLPGRQENVKVVNLEVIDGSGKTILARLATTLTDRGVHLKRGHLLKLDLFNHVTIKPNEHSPSTPAILIVKMSVVGQGPIIFDPNDVTTPYMDEMAMPDLSNVAASENIPAEATECIELGQPGWDDDFEPPPSPIDPCTPSNRLCSMYGVRMTRCVSKKFPVASEDLQGIAPTCYFVNTSVDSMTPSHKRNLLCWSYATNIYTICGKDSRGPLPPCLVYAIRLAYPNPKGIPYKGYMPSGSNSRKRKASNKH